MYHIFSSNITKSIGEQQQHHHHHHTHHHHHHSNLDEKKRFNGKILFIVVLGLIFHSVFAISIFDIYFRSPLVHGMTPQKINLPAPAQRLVLFVADGLRADKFYEMVDQPTHSHGNKVSRAPYLRDIVENVGSWGVSHTRVPTETRPGHVALIAGFYEDVSAVTKGWKSNPVEFDHVFNQSTYSFGYGSPDILPMFSDHVPHMTSESYPPEAEDFGHSDASYLDTWVFEKIEELFNNSTKDLELKKKLQSDKLIIFLHLLGLDTNGHAYRPYSQEYYNNIGIVDSGIKKTVKLINQYYGDDKTSFVFTADHGMSNRGSHGDGERANTETPLVAWGAGVRGPLSSSLQMDRVTKLRGKAREILNVNSETPDNWRLSNLLRSDVSQADIAPLMSTLIGVPCPLNSVGVLPTDYLSTDSKYTTHALYANTMQIWEMFKLKSTQKKENSFFFRQYPGLVNADKIIGQINSFMENALYDDAQVLCLEFIDLCLAGLNYFQTYDRPFLMTIITMGYLGWIITLCLYVINNYTTIGFKCDKDKVESLIPSIDKLSKYLIITMTVLLFGFLLSNDAPILYYLYCSFVIFFWGKTIPANVLPFYLYVQSFMSSNRYSTSRTSGSNQSFLGSSFKMTIFVIIFMELLVVAYFDRRVLSVLYVVVGLMWTIGSDSKHIAPAFKICWLLSCCSMAIFPNIPLDYGNDTRLVCLGGILIFAIGSLTIYYVNNKTNWSSGSGVSSSMTVNAGKSKYIQGALLVSIIFATWLVYSTDSALEKKTGLPYFNQLASWILLVTSCIILSPLKGKHHYQHWIYMSLALSIPFILLSINYEPLFFGCFIFNLSLWMFIEVGIEEKQQLQQQQSQQSQQQDNITSFITQNDITRSIIYVFFCYVGFFGVGNIASISSFEISSTYRFTTIFDPFLMAALLLCKIFIPLLLVSISYSLLNNRLHIPRPASFLIVIAISDIMSINFFFLVKDTGSWLEIGMSISHFAISNAIIILQLLLSGVSSAIVPTSFKVKIKQ